MRLADIKQQIATHSPQIDLQSLQLLGEGTESRAYLVNQEWVFCFPQSSETKKTLRTEIALLPQLSEVLQIKIPHFTYVAKDTDRLVYVGYKRLPGVFLTRDLFAGLGNSKQEQVLKDLASFLQALHSFPANTASNCGVRVELYKGAYHKEQRCLLEQLQPLLSKDELAQIQAAFSTYEQDETHFPPPALLHADLKPDHILLDPERGRITSIIDWGDVCLGDPDFDLACLCLFYDQHFLRKLLKYLPLANIQQTLTKIQFFILIRWLQDTALFLSSGDNKLARFCLENLRSHLKSLQT